LDTTITGAGNLCYRGNKKGVSIMKKPLKIILAVVLLVVIIVGVLFLVVLPATLNSAAKLQTYDFGEKDKIPSFNSVVGERKVTGVSTGSSTGGAQEKSYTYETDTLGDDLDAYVDALRASDILITKALDGNKLKGSMQLGCASADEGKIILIDLAWDNTRAVVQLTKGDGAITPN
jgi:hypothetical protein